MLKHEDEIILGSIGKDIYANPLYCPRITLTPEYAIHRNVLSHFGFSTTYEDVANYRKIFSHYYKSPTSFDKDVLSSVAYMRENKCVYYSEPVINIKDTIKDVSLYDLDGETKISLIEFIKQNNANYTFIGAFSTS